ncbi:MAG: segregation/condensation protein A [bacterium]|nr:segregation/condensation protein A [bacterium]
MTEISYKLEKFEGPLDLLLHLIEKNKVNIYDIPIVEITTQYLEYVSQMQKQDLNLVSEFLVMAATLLNIKARMLLPKTESEEELPEDDPRAELVARLLEYKMYKFVAEELSEREEEALRVFYKKPTIPKEVAKYEPPVNLDLLLDGLTLDKLERIFQSVLRRQENKVDPVRSRFRTIQKEPVSLEEKIHEVLHFASMHQRWSFREFLMGQRDRFEVVVTFLALLELMKVGKIRLYQEEAFADMQVETVEGREADAEEWKWEGMEDFDGETAGGDGV